MRIHRFLDAALFLSILLFGLHQKTSAEEPGKLVSANYGRPFEPPTRPAFIPLPPGKIEPTGWLRDWANINKDGYTGHMEDVDVAFKQAWAVDYKMTGENLTFWERGAWPYEGGGYWFDGLNKLGFALGDDALKAKAKLKFEAVINNMNDKGILFMWWLDKNKPADKEALLRQAGGEANAWPIWANSIFGRSLCGYYLATEDKNALKTLESAYTNDLCWTDKDAPETNIWPAFETYTWTGNKTIGKCIDEFFEKYKIEPPMESVPLDQCIRMIKMHYNRYPDQRRPWYKQPDHGVRFNECTIPWLVGYLWTGNADYLKSQLRWYDIIERGDEGMQPHGVPVGDENSGPTGSLRGTETCDVAAFTWSQITLLRVSGEGRLADRVERAVFNAGPSVADRDFKNHVYHQFPNRLNPQALPYPPFVYNKTQMPMCCTAALNRILPNYLAHMWMATYDNGLAATHYGPCKVRALVAERVPVEIECKTNYPFDDSLEISVKPERGAEFPLSFRVPGWCDKPEIAVNGEVCSTTAEKGFVRIARVWKAGDIVKLHFPMTARVKSGHDNNAGDTPYATVSYGPLLFALAIPDTKDANTADDKAKWKYALDAPEGKTDLDISVDRRPMPESWKWQIDSPLTLTVTGRNFDWNATPRQALPAQPVGPEDASPFQPDVILTQLPKQAVPDGGETEKIRLVPYGCTKFRVSMFPVTERALKTLESEKAPQEKK
jgi:hypothetical protein